MNPAYLAHPKTFLKAIYTAAGENMNRVMAIILLTAGSAAWGLAAESEIQQEPITLKMVAPNRYHNGSAPSGRLTMLAGQQPKTVVIFVHPDGDSRNTWQTIPLAREGFAVFGMATRYTKENQHLIMEEVVLDLAEAIRYLKQERGFSHVLLHGHSGGGSAVGFYQQQATLSPPNRVKSTPAGDPPDLNQFDLPKADGLIISAAHLGRGAAVARKLDPSVVDEEDPVAFDPSLDMFNPENGFRPNENSHYSEEFVQRFTAAQQARMDRLIAKARAMVAERRMYQELLKAPHFSQRPLLERLRIERAAIAQRYMVIYRNWANLHPAVMSIDPSDRVPGWSGGARIDLNNYFDWFHPRVITPEALLSSESTVSNAYSPQTLPTVTVPTLVIIGTADPTARLAESRTAYEALAAKDKELVLIVGADHGYRPAGPKAGKGDQREQAIQALVDWFSPRFPR